jgi:ABC-type branched-subunit amino acid transport system ATPase component
VKDLMIGILATSISVTTDFTMLLMLSAGLFFVDPVMAIATIAIFLLVGLGLYRLLGVRSAKIGKLLSEFTIESNQKILEVLNSYREAVVRNRRNFYSKEITQLRFRLGKVNAEWNFQPYISKYVIEATTIVGSLFLGAFEFATNNAVHAVAVLSVFLAASSRIAPAALRIQQGLLTIKHSSGSAETTLDLLSKLKSIQVLDEGDQDPLFSYDDFEPDISLAKVSFRYPNSNFYALKNINLEISFGTSVAIVGPSGAGKTTLVDVILGVLVPEEGIVKTSGFAPGEASKRWPGGISYVPQNVVVASGTIKQNVGLGYDSRVVTDDRVWAALRVAHLGKEIEQFPNALDENVGENGNKVSGGQKQRLGIARALFSNPKLLILDEATSSLDGQTEAGISQAINALHGKATVIVVAHRLSTVRSVAKIIYMSAGEIVAEGSFEEIRSLVPDFDTQASLMGL